MLKITKSSEPIHVKTLVGVIYAPPGLGKTTLGFTSDKPLLLDFDKGSHRARNRRDVVLVDKWADVAEMSAGDFAGYSTVVVDTAGRALDALAVDIIKENPKLAYGGTLNLQGYGKLKARFADWIKLVRSFGLDVILIAHSDENRKGDEVIERLDIQGGSKNEIYKSADFMGRILMADGRRMLNLSPTETAFGKNPGQLPPLDIPDYDKDPAFLGSVIARTKEAINALTEEQTKVAALQAEWQTKIEGLTDADAFNATIDEAKAADEAVRDTAKRMLLKAAQAKGLTFDKGTGKFSGPPAREPGADDGDEDAANRKAAEPTQTEIEAHETTQTKPSRKAKAA